MDLVFKSLLASSLDKVINIFKENNLNYKLIELKPPYDKKAISKKNEIKRVLNIKKENDSYKIYWSFQYNK